MPLPNYPRESVTIVNCTPKKECLPTFQKYRILITNLPKFAFSTCSINGEIFFMTCIIFKTPSVFDHVSNKRSNELALSEKHTSFCACLQEDTKSVNKTYPEFGNLVTNNNRIELLSSVNELLPFTEIMATFPVIFTPCLALKKY